jgi:hypothetical protein
MTKNKIGYCHHECCPLGLFSGKYTQGNLQNVRANLYKGTKQGIPTHVYWIIAKYGKTKTKDHKENCQRMAIDWHPSKGFKPLTTRLFIGASYASAARYPMKNRDVIDIGLHVLKPCRMYSKEYKKWFACENESLPIVKSIESFKEYWANAIALIN